MSVRYLLDTHTLIFMARAPHLLGPKARRAIDTADKNELGISATTIAELGQLIHHGKLKFEGRPSDVFGTAPSHGRVTWKTTQPTPYTQHATAETATGPRSFTPPAAPSPGDEADGKARFWAWVWIAVCTVAAGFGFTQS
ncbi:MAG: hypothetical protein H7067_08700 [Burkholderiales bacterium]|nr:hypothetical protein [Opitutaceae bacterium]